MSKEYWFCLIGPIEKEKVHQGGDFPLRQAVKDAFERTTGEDAEMCSSGWGVDEEEAEAMRKAQNDAFRRRHNIS
jgi:hypothetical protein